MGNTYCPDSFIFRNKFCSRTRAGQSWEGSLLVVVDQMAKAVLFQLYFMTLFCLSSLVDLVNGTWCRNTFDLTVHMESGHSVAKDVWFNLCMLTSI